MRLSKRKDKLIRDIVEAVIGSVERILTKGPNNPQTVELDATGKRGLDVQPIFDAIDRLGERIEDAILAATQTLLERQALEVFRAAQTTPSPTYPIADAEYDMSFGDVPTETGRLMIENIGPGDDAFRLVAYLPGARARTPQVFKRGPRAACVDAWDDAVEWMKARLAEKWA